MVNLRMNIVSFDQLLTMNIPGVKVVKPGEFFQKIEVVKAADIVLFPPYYLLNTIVYALHKSVFPSISTGHLGHSKVEMTRAFQAFCPENMPETLILADSETARCRILDEFYFPFIAKEIRSARGCGVKLIENYDDFIAYASQNEVLYVQMLLPIDRDMRIVRIGSEVVAAYYRVAREGSYLNNVYQGGHVIYDEIPSGAIELVNKVANQFDIDFAGFDVAEVDGHFYFFEFNNRFGNQALVNSGCSLEELIMKYIINKFKLA